MKNTLFLLLMLITTGLFSQNSSYALKFMPDFSTKNTQTVSAVYQLNIKETYQFIHISAFTKNPNCRNNFYYRIRNHKKWSRWIQLQKDTESIDNDRSVFFTNPVYHRMDEIQFKTDFTPEKPAVFRLFIAVPNDKPQETQAAHTRNCSLPDYCDRDCWCPSGNCNPQGSPQYTTPTHIIVHHSGTNYSNGTDYKLVVQSYWDYHVNTHGWNDIGYNWLTDPNGVLYEGRGSGVQGAHFSCMNSHTMGVCVIGNFETATPTTETITTLEDLIAWEATDKDIDVLTHSYHSASQLDLYHISGHRDGNPSPVGCPSGTLCPGANLYALLPDIRIGVSNYPCYITADTDAIPYKSLSAYPIPVHHLLHLQWKNTVINPDIKLFDHVGMLLKELDYKADNMDFSPYNTGIYYLQIRSENSLQTIKIIKK